jgi:hypothetical protein
MAARKRARRAPLNAVQREARNQVILNLFLAGYPPRAIAEQPQVKLSLDRVRRIIRDELDRATKDHILRNENAMIIYLARLEQLVRASFDHVNDGDLKAIEVTRRLLREQADIYGLADISGRAPAPVPPMSDQELEPADELARYRAQRDQKSG